MFGWSATLPEPTSEQIVATQLIQSLRIEFWALNNDIRVHIFGIGLQYSVMSHPKCWFYWFLQEGSGLYVGTFIIVG